MPQAIVLRHFFEPEKLLQSELSMLYRQSRYLPRTTSDSLDKVLNCLAIFQFVCGSFLCLIYTSKEFLLCHWR